MQYGREKFCNGDEQIIELLNLVVNRLGLATSNLVSVFLSIARVR